MLELCEKSLFDFMEAKRKAFPRFYFVSTKDLLDILSNGNRPDRVMEHIPKIFQAIQRLDLKDEGGIKVGIGMYSPQEEYVEFAKPCPLNGKVEMWLHRTIDSMQEALRVVLKKSIEALSSAVPASCPCQLLPSLQPSPWLSPLYLSITSSWMQCSDILFAGVL